MSIFVPNKVYLRGILLHYFIQKKSAAEAHRILVQTYGDNALSDTTCRDWFRRFKNNDFQLEDKERSGAPKKFQDKELEQLLDSVAPLPSEKVPLARVPTGKNFSASMHSKRRSAGKPTRRTKGTD
ncbi:MOS1T transposase, partial [Pseudoatta argentina]